MQIQQMVFMILGIFLFFILVGLFFLSVSLGGLRRSASELNEEQALSSLNVLADMPELNYDSRSSLTLDEDKLRVMSGSLGNTYEGFWPVASIKVYKLYPRFDSPIKCPAADCNYFDVYTPSGYENLSAGDSDEESIKTTSTYVSICKITKTSGYVYDDCEVGKLVVGVKNVGE
jgi:hypothetical protein